ncbi:alpha/beta hydrolase [Mycobacteroides abscessus]|uniref:alpha/beta hydrolase n=1 Tax=Mycobacteroides abscessus TaxID=36809 RepID=UPI000A6F2272|nr:alpha/beta hydrolase [Mycobacteroides abscessus]
MTEMSRRRLLQLGAALGAGATLLPALAAPARAAVEVTSGSFISEARGGIPTGWKIARPPGVDWPVRPVIMLHGRDENADRTIYWGYERMLGDLVTAGAPPFAVAAIDGGNSYWHPHTNGDDPGAMIIDEFIPMLADQEGLDVSRVAFMGWSAGGYGALLNGARLGGPRTAAIAAVSPSIWMTYPEATADAFDDEENWAENTVFGLPQLNGIPLWVSAGFDDRFYAASKTFAEQLPAPPAGEFGPGAHEGGYWLSQVPQALGWIAPILAG